MESRLNKPLILAMVIVALVLGVLVGMATGVADRLFGPNPKTIANASLESMRAENRLTVFAARYVSVVTSEQQRLGGLVSSERTLVLPGDVRYELDLSKLQNGDVSWDGSTHTLKVKLPEIEVAGPDVDINAVREYGGGGVLSALTNANQQLDSRARGHRLAKAGDCSRPAAARASVGAHRRGAKLRDAAARGRLQGRESRRPLPDRGAERRFLYRSLNPI